MSKTISVSQMAKVCKVSTETIRRWIDKGAIASSKTLGGHRRILIDDFLKFLKQNDMPYDRRLLDQKRRILIIDDESGVIDILKGYVAELEEDYEVDSASSGFEAGQRVAESSPDIIFLDIVMPGMDGFEVCQMLKNDIHTKDIRIIAMTGYATDENIQKIMECGAGACLKKPFSFETFKDAILSLD